MSFSEERRMVNKSRFSRREHWDRNQRIGTLSLGSLVLCPFFACLSNLVVGTICSTQGLLFLGREVRTPSSCTAEEGQHSIGLLCYNQNKNIKLVRSVIHSPNPNDSRANSIRLPGDPLQI